VCGTSRPPTHGGIGTVARSKIRPEAELRTYLHTEAKAFMHQMVNILLEDGPESAEYAYRQLSGRVDAIASGEEVWLHRYELPPGHALEAPQGGHPCDSLMLGSDNVLRPSPSHQPVRERRSPSI
jgi:hypothetical protein